MFSIMLAFGMKASLLQVLLPLLFYHARHGEAMMK